MEDPIAPCTVIIPILPNPLHTQQNPQVNEWSGGRNPAVCLTTGSGSGLGVRTPAWLVGWRHSSESSVRGDGGDLAAAVGEDAGEAEEEGEEGAVGEDDEEAAGNPSVHVQPVAREHVPHRPCAEGGWGWGGASNDLSGCGRRVPSGATGRERAPKGEFLDCGAHGTINGVGTINGGGVGGAEGAPKAGVTVMRTMRRAAVRARIGGAVPAGGEIHGTNRWSLIGRDGME